MAPCWRPRRRRQRHWPGISATSITTTLPTPEHHGDRRRGVAGPTSAPPPAWPSPSGWRWRPMSSTTTWRRTLRTPMTAPPRPSAPSRSSRSATITATSVAASRPSPSQVDSARVSPAQGAEATNVILGKDNAYASGSKLTSAGAVSITSTYTSDIEAKIVGVSVSLGLGSGPSVGVAIGVSVARNYIGYAPTAPTTAPKYKSSDNVLTLNPGDTVQIDGGARSATFTSTSARITPCRSITRSRTTRRCLFPATASRCRPARMASPRIRVFQYVGQAGQQSRLGFAELPGHDQVEPGDRQLYGAVQIHDRLHSVAGQGGGPRQGSAGTDGVSADSVFEYIGTNPLANPNLATQNYSDTKSCAKSPRFSRITRTERVEAGQPGRHLAASGQGIRCRYRSGRGRRIPSRPPQPKPSTRWSWQSQARWPRPTVSAWA